MIDRVHGLLEGVGDGEARLRVGPLVLRALVSPQSAAELAGRVGQEAVLYTVVYLQGPGMGTLEPVLLGFATERERDFYELLTSLDGLGPRAALRLLAQPVEAIARAIAAGDAAWLQRLPGVGRQRASDLVSRLREKVAPFLEADDGAPVAAVRASGGPVPGAAGPTVDPELRADVMAVLVQLGYGPREAERMIDQAAARRPEARDAETLLYEIFRASGPAAAGGEPA